MRPSGEPVTDFLASLPERRRDEAERLCAVLAEVSGEPATMWARGTVGFGQYHYRYDSGHEGDAPQLAERSVRVHRGIDRTSSRS